MGPKYVFNVIQKYIDCEMFNNDNILIQSLKFFIKHLIWNFKFHKYNKSRRNIFLLTSRRSGGTWIMQALSRIKNTKSVIEPFNYGYRDVFNRRHYSQELLKNGFPKLESNRKDVINFLNKLFYSNSIKCQEQWRIFSSDFHFLTTRTVVKLHTPKIFIEDLQKEYPNDKFIFLIRNPIPQVLSILNLEMKSLDYINWFLEDQKYIDKYLSSEQIKFAKHIAQNGKVKEKLFLTWVLENKPVIEFSEKKNLLMVKYEDVVLNKSFIIQKIEHYLNEDLPLKKSFDNPSITSFNSKDMIRSQNKNQILNRWQSEVSIEEVKVFQNILDKFDITTYSFSSFIDNEKRR